MRVAIDYGRQHAELEIAAGAFVGSHVQAPPPALADPAAATRRALEKPYEFPPLHRALTPDDQVAVIVDEHLPQLPALLVPLLEYLAATVSPEAITLLVPASSAGQPWLDELPEALEEVRCEVHLPQDRKRLSFVTTTKKGHALYFNRTAVDASQVVVLTGRRYDPLLGHGGGEGALYPAFSDEATRTEASQHPSLDVPGERPWRLHQEATEAAWLLGVPFFVQVIEGYGDAVAEVVGGVAPSLAEGQHLQDLHWRRVVSRGADTVVASLSGDPARHGVAELASALACASRVLRPNGRIVLLSEARPAQGPATELLRQADEPADALAEIKRRKDFELSAAWQWATVAQQARIFLLSGLPADAVEEMFAVPLEDVGQAQRLVAASGSCLFLTDAHKTLAVVES